MTVKEIREKMEAKKVEVRSALDKEDAENAKKLNEELRGLKDNLAIAEELEKEEKEELQAQAEKREKEKKEPEVVDVNKIQNRDSVLLRAMVKTMMKKDLNKTERALLATGAGGGATGTNWGTNGEGYILPQSISTNINKLVRQYMSFRTVLGHFPTTTLTGSFPVEGYDTVTGLVDFSEDNTTTVPEANEIKFTNKKYALAEKGAIVPMSNTLLSFTDQGLEAYIAEYFAKKAVITENTMGYAKLIEGKTIKAIADWKALKKSINKDLDPAAYFNLKIVTNQSGFDVLDEALDSYGRPVLQPNPTNPTQKLFMGYPVVVFSDSMLPNVNTGTTEAPVYKAPIFYGDLQDAVKFVDNGTYSFAVSTEAGFLKNMTYSRVIEYIDVVQVDDSDKIYIAAQLPITA